MLLRRIWLRRYEHGFEIYRELDFRVGFFHEGLRDQAYRMRVAMFLIW